MAIETISGIEAQLLGLKPIASSSKEDLYRTANGFYICKRGKGISLADDETAKAFLSRHAPQKLADFKNIKPQLQHSSHSEKMLYR